MESQFGFEGMEFQSAASDAFESPEVNDALDAAFPLDSVAEMPSDADAALDQAFPPVEPGGLEYQPSETGVQYPDPERMEGNVGGPERLG
jgi:hypothetical protein